MLASRCAPAPRDYLYVVSQALFGVWLLMVLASAPWQHGFLAGAMTFGAIAAISLAVQRKVVDPLLRRLFFRGGRVRHCLDLRDRFRIPFPRLPGLRGDQAWAAVANVSYLPRQTYYASPEWHQRRALKLAEAGHRCQTCGTIGTLQVHHLTYRRLGRERRSDLRVLCCGCHSRVHGRNTCTFGNR
jgi:5-methylcytosine-specific restriction endonuclease McrA